MDRDWADLVQPAGPRTVCDFAEHNVVRGDAGGVRTGTVSDGSRPVCGTISSSTTGGTLGLHGCHWVVASAEYPGCSWAPAVVLMQCLHDVFLTCRSIHLPNLPKRTFPLGGGGGNG